jgi:hypothetical protein
MKNPVRNLVAVSAANPQSAADAKAAVLALARAKDAEGAGEDAAGRVTFTVEWEPTFKDIKELSMKHKDVTFTLYADSFAKQHWICKAVYLAGKASEENTFSRIDGENFRKVYQEIFGEAFAVGR